MEDEIDLRPWFFAVLRRWQLIVSMALLLALLAGISSAIQPKVHGAHAEVLILPATVEISLDQRFVNRDGISYMNTVTRNQALLGLATSSAVVQRVASALEIEQPSNDDLTDLLDKIEVTADGDLITITAYDEDGAYALTLAEVWAHTYERVVIETYSRDALMAQMLEDQLVVAQQNYAVRQAELEVFLKQNRVHGLRYQKRSLDGLIDGIIRAEYDLYTAYAQRVRELEVFLQDAATLRAQFQAGMRDEFTNGLALLSLRTRFGSIAGSSSLPLQLLIGDGAIFTNAPATVEDLDTLIAAMEQERLRLATGLEGMARGIRQGETGLIGFDAETLQAHQIQLASLSSEIAQLEEQERLLTESRNTAFNSVQLLQNKLEEQRIAELTSPLTVRTISLLPEPPRSRLGNIGLFGGAGLLIGFMAGLCIALGQEIVRRVREGGQAGGAVALGK